MATPSVQFGAFGGNTRGVDPVDGVSSFHTLVDISEPASVGAPPVVPTLVKRAGRRAVVAPRMARSRSGHCCAHPMSTASRAVFEVEWGAVGGADERHHQVGYVCGSEGCSVAGLFNTKAGGS